MNDDFLRTSIDDAVDDVEPTDRLGAIRARTTSRSRARRGWFAAGGSLLAAAAAVALVLTVGGSPSPTAVDPADGPAPQPTPVTTRSPGAQSFTVFQVGPGPDGPAGPAHTLYGARADAVDLAGALTSTPTDPDYRTLWPAGSLGEIVDGGDFVVVDLTDESLADLPDGMSEEEADLALQQVVYTVQAAFDTDAGVLFELAGSTDAETVYGRPVGRDGLVGSEPALSVLNHMSIDTPTERTVVPRTDRALVVTGRGNSFEAGGSCFLVDDTGEVVGERGLAQMRGWTEPRLYPFELELDLTDVPAGTYVLTCLTDDPTGGTEGRGADSDTRTVIVE